MDLSADQLREVVQWDVRNWSKVLPFWETELQRRSTPLNVLAIGEREGGLSLWLARMGHHVTCTDLHTMPPATRALHERYGMQDRITYATVDATAIPFPDASFDVVVFKSVIGALGTKERQTVAIAEMHRVLRPGGVLLFAENLSGTRLHGFLRKRFIAWEHYWRYLHWPGDRDLFAAFATSRFRTFGLFANLGRTEGQRTALSYVDEVLTKLLPARWRYILAGICTK